jgi:hypothetical protein
MGLWGRKRYGPRHSPKGGAATHRLAAPHHPLNHCAPPASLLPLLQLTRGMEKTVAALVKELQAVSSQVHSDKDLANVASVSAGNNADIGKLISDAMAKVSAGEGLPRAKTGPRLVPRTAHGCVARGAGCEKVPACGAVCAAHFSLVRGARPSSFGLR